MFDKNIFSERLSYLRKTHNISALTIAKELGISKAAISQFENCANYPHVNTLTSLADYFHVSIDYLTGRRHPAPESLPPPLRSQAQE